MNWGPGGGPCCGRSEPQVRPLECELLARLCSFLPRGTQNKHCSQTSRGWGSGMASHICNPSTQEIPASKTNPSAQERQIQGVSGRSGATKQPLPPRPRVWGLPIATSNALLLPPGVSLPPLLHGQQRAPPSTGPTHPCSLPPRVPSSLTR